MKNSNCADQISFINMHSKPGKLYEAVKIEISDNHPFIH